MGALNTLAIFFQFYSKRGMLPMDNFSRAIDAIYTFGIAAWAFYLLMKG
jgi:hypothetical protein